MNKKTKTSKPDLLKKTISCPMFGLIRKLIPRYFKKLKKNNITQYLTFLVVILSLSFASFLYLYLNIKNKQAEIYLAETGSFTCTANDEFEVVASESEEFISCPLPEGSSPSIISPPYDKDIQAGSNITFTLAGPIIPTICDNGKEGVVWYKFRSIYHSENWDESDYVYSPWQRQISWTSFINKTGKMFIDYLVTVTKDEYTPPLESLESDRSRRGPGNDYRVVSSEILDNCNSLNVKDYGNRLPFKEIPDDKKFISGEKITFVCEGGTKAAYIVKKNNQIIMPAVSVISNGFRPLSFVNARNNEAIGNYEVFCTLCANNDINSCDWTKQCGPYRFEVIND